jgi:hydrogenase nickel insertion protein HypA
MHEAAAIQGAVRTALEYMQQADASRVTEVQLSVGVSGHVTEEGVRQYFALFSADTPAAGARLSINWLPATYQCFTCLHIFQSLKPPGEALCPECGEAALEIDHQDACAVTAIDVVFDEIAKPRIEPYPRTTIFLGEETWQWQA